MAEVAVIKPDGAGRILAEASDAVYLNLRTQEGLAAGHPPGARDADGRITVPGGKAVGLPVATGASGKGRYPVLKKKAGR